MTQEEKEIKINCPEEVWKDMPRYKTLYKISNLGRVTQIFQRKNN